MNYFTPTNQSNHRQRPLQKSMFLPDNHQKQQQPIHPRQHPADYIHYNPLKRSSIPVLERIHQSNSSSSIHYNNVGYSQIPHPASNINISTQNINDNRPLTPQDHYQLSFSSNSKPLNTMAKQESLSENHTLNISKFEKIQSNQVKKNGSVQYGDSEMMINNKIFGQLSQRWMNKMLVQIKKQLNKQLSALKQQVHDLKAQIKQTNEKQQHFNLQLKNQTTNIINYNNNINVNNHSKNKKEQIVDMKELQKLYGVIQKKYNQLEFKINQNMLNIYQDIQKLTHKVQYDHKEKSFKISQIKSTLPPIMLEYKESFVVKRSAEYAQSGSSNSQQIIINRYQYFIDRNGYLLDQERRYLTDLRGNQIKLDEKHLKLLQQFKIINK